jgi:phage terminase small subunit
MRGRKPKPTALKLLEGCRADRVNVFEAVLPPGSVVAPDWLEGLAKEHWDEIAPLLASSGILTAGDRAALAVLCDEYRRWRTDPDDTKSRDRYRRMLVELGLTPSSRSRIKAQPERPKDELGDFLGEKTG